LFRYRQQVRPQVDAGVARAEFFAQVLSLKQADDRPDGY
jgi:hypothetical protein